MWVRASEDQEGSGEDRLASGAVHTLSWNIHVTHLSSSLWCNSTWALFSEQRKEPLWFSLPNAPAWHPCLLGLCDGGLPVSWRVAGSTHGGPRPWSTVSATTVGEVRRSPSGCQRLLGHQYSKAHTCGRASGQAAPSGGQGHPHSQETCSKLFCSSSSVCNQLQSKDWKSTGRLKIHLRWWLFFQEATSTV